MILSRASDAFEISYLKKIKDIYDRKQYENNPDGELNAIEAGEIPAYFNFTGRVVFISNLPKDKSQAIFIYFLS